MVKKKKSTAKISPKAGASNKGYSRVEWACVGADVSMSSIALGVIAKTTQGKIRTGTAAIRWQKDHDYFDRILTASKVHDLMHDLFSNAKLMTEPEQVYIAVEEAVAIGHLQRGASAWMKQQLQISGALLGGLIRYGWKNIYEIQAHQWQVLVAADLGITIHHTKWNPDKVIGKYRAQQWIEQFHPKWDGHWVDIIQDPKLGRISRPKGRKAKGVQSDDRYEALAIANWMKTELKRSDS